MISSMKIDFDQWIVVLMTIGLAGLSPQLFGKRKNMTMMRTIKRSTI
jgi:hypothetical protein